MEDEDQEDRYKTKDFPAYITIEAIANAREGDGQDGGQDENTAVVGKEQFMNIKVMAQKFGKNVQTQKTHLIIAADFSGSMGGNPAKQVKEALKDMVSSTLSVPYITTDIIVYNSSATLLQFNADNYNDVIDKLTAGSMTDFACVFKKLDELFQKGNPSTRVYVVFMTDGCDTCNKDIKETTKNWTEKLGALQREIIIHTVGFSAGHNFEFMKTLCNAGKTEGMYRYCEPGDGQTVLQEKLQELFDFIVLGSSSVNVAVTINGDNKFLHQGEMVNSCILEGNVIQTEDDQDKYEITADSWIYLSNTTSVPKIDISVSKEDKKNEEISYPCEVVSVKTKVLESASDKGVWNLRILSRNADILAVKVSNVISNKEDIGKVRDRVNKLQEKMKDTQIFGQGINKELREDMIKFLKEITTKVDMMLSMLATYARGETENVSMLARAHDMRFQCNFSKSRRQRLMDKRATKNMSQAKDSQDTLSMLQVDKQEVEALTNEAIGFYFCALSQNSVKDILLGSDKDDVIGFGLAVKRPEHVLDEPTSIRLWNISGTLVSRNAMLDALEYKIKIDGHLSAHGGFNFNNSTLGVTTIGLAREPINAWLPLYVTKSHWDRVKVLLKPSLGYFCTLDPLGYDYKQIDTMFMVLGNMVGQLSEKSIGEHQIKLIFTFQRTCYACAQDFDLTQQIYDIVKKFIDSPAGRTKDVIPNLTVLIGYILSLPAKKIQEIFYKDGSVESSTVKKFWTAYLVELIRRSAGAVYRESSPHVINGIIDILSHGKAQESDKVCTMDKANRDVIHLCHSAKNEDLTFDIPTYDPTAGLTMPKVEDIKPDFSLDKAMEIWARSELHTLQTKAQASAVKKSKYKVDNWQKDLISSVVSGYSNLVKSNTVGGEEKSESNKKESQTEASLDDNNKSDNDALLSAGDIDREEETESCDQELVEKEQTTHTFDAQIIKESMINLVTMLNRKLGNSAFPSLRSIPSCIAFLNFWLKLNEDFQTMDNNSGLPPDQWIKDVKQAVKSVYSQISSCKVCEEQNATNIEDPNTLVVKATNEEVENVNSAPNITLQSDAENTQNLPENGTDIVSTKTCSNDGSHGNIGNYGNTMVGDDDDDDDDDFDDNDFEDGIDYTDTAHTHHSDRKHELQTAISVPVLLHLLNIDLDLIQLMRVLFSQAVRYHSNSLARNAIQENKFTDLSATETLNCEEELQVLHNTLQTIKENAVKNVINSFVWRIANRRMLTTDSIWTFLGYMMNVYSERSEGFSYLITEICNAENATKYPELKEKVKVMFCGKYDDKPVIAKGNVWLPEQKVSKKLSAVLGEEDWFSIEVDLRSKVQLHVYRASDIPNRHGHCNSNPYIPNLLRAKLGMPLLKENKRRTRSRRLRSKHT